MTQGFDEWYKETGSLLPRRAYMAGAASRQDEIDKLKMSNHHLAVQLQDSHDHYDYIKNERDKLQKRIEFLEKVICENLDERFLNVDFKNGESNE